MGPTPLYDALCAFAAADPLRLHIPGHKGRPMPLPQLTAAAQLDVTELPPTGDLFSGDGPIRQAEDLWAQAAGMRQCLFLTGGSTQGMLAALTLTSSPQSTLLLDRASHRSAYNALALLDLNPIYLPRPWLPEAGVLGAISPQAVEDFLKKHPETKTICITSPTYYGVLSDIPALAAVVHAHGGTLVVDGAHGAHLPFLGYTDFSAADLVVMSAHKTLPALGQSALLLGGDAFSHPQLCRAAALYGSSSPSYLLMASLDAARAWLEDEGSAAYRAVCRQVSELRRRFPSLAEEPLSLDPTRFVLRTGDGFSLQAALHQQGIYPEMADCGHVVFVFTCADGARDSARLSEALSCATQYPVQVRSAPPPPPFPTTALSPRQARFSPTQAFPLYATAGKISAQQVAPYPPGVPVVAAGERIDKKHLAYLSQIGYNMEEEVQIVSPNFTG